MGFWSKLGKIALQAAPYIAAPFTGGASLAFVPATQKLGQEWSQHDANEAAKKGLAPSSFDKYLGMASSAAGAAGGSGAFGGGDFSAENFGGQNQSGVSPYANTLNNVVSRTNFGNQNQGDYSYGRGQETATSRSGGSNQSSSSNGNNQGISSFGRRMQRQLGPVMGAQDQSNPNLAMALGAGRMDAINNQPWRSGYDVHTQGDEPADDSQGNVGQDIVSTMPPIYPNGQRRRMPQYAGGM